MGSGTAGIRTVAQMGSRRVQAEDLNHYAIVPDPSKFNFYHRDYEVLLCCGMFLKQVLKKLIQKALGFIRLLSSQCR